MRAPPWRCRCTMPPGVVRAIVGLAWMDEREVDDAETLAAIGKDAASLPA